MNELTKIALIDPRVKVGEAVFKVETAGLSVQPTEIPADQQGVYSNTILFNSVIIPNSQQTCVSKAPRIAYDVTVTVPTGGSAAGVPCFATALDPANCLYPNPNATFKARPLMSVCQAANITINSAVTATQPRYLLTAMQRYLPKELLQHATAPIMPDNLGKLIPTTTSVALTGSAQTLALASSSNQPMSLYDNSTQLSRAAFIPSSVQINVGGNDIYTFHFEEDIFPVSPFVPGYIESAFLYNVFNLSINLNFASFTDMIYDLSNSNPSTYTVSVSNAKLETTYITIDPNLIKIPAVAIYDYALPTLYVKDLGQQTIQQLGSIVVQSDSLRFNSCPKRIWCMVQPNINYRNPSSNGSVGNAKNVPGSDVALTLASNQGLYAGGETWNDVSFDDSALSRIQVTYGTMSYEVACTPRELFLEAVKNGYNSTYTDFLLGSGSILCFNPMTQFGFNAGTDVAQGENGTVTFRIQMSVSFVNLLKAGLYNSGGTMPLQLVVIAEYAGQLALSNNQQGLFSLGVVGPKDVAEMFSKPLPSVDQLPEGLKGEGAGLNKGHIVHHLAAGKSGGMASSKSVLSKK